MTDYYLLQVESNNKFWVLDVNDETPFAYTCKQVEDALSMGVEIGFLDTTTMTMPTGLIVDYKYDADSSAHIMRSYFTNDNNTLFNIYSRKLKNWTNLENFPLNYEANDDSGRVKIRQLKVEGTDISLHVTAHLENYYQLCVGESFKCKAKYPMGKSHDMRHIAWELDYSVATNQEREHYSF